MSHVIDFFNTVSFCIMASASLLIAVAWLRYVRTTEETNGVFISSMRIAQVSNMWMSKNFQHGLGKSRLCKACVMEQPDV